MLNRFAACSLNQTPFEYEANLDRLLSATRAAKSEYVSLLLLPELSISGYGLEDGFYFPEVVSKSLDALERILPETDGISVLLGLPLPFENELYNAACLVTNKKIQGIYFKQNLANYGIHYEKRWFSAWPAKKVIDYKILGEKVPAGDVLFQFEDGARVSIEICHDAWVENRPLEGHKEFSPDIVLNPSASHFAFSKYEFVRNLVLDSSKKYSLTYLYANLLGNEAGKVVYDGASFIASDGKMLAEATRFQYDDFNLTSFALDIKPKNSKSSSKQIINIDTSLLESKNSSKTPKLPSLLSKFEEFSESAFLGLFDYLRKSKTKGFTVSLSGGADSAATSLLVYYMTGYATKYLGLDGTLKRLGLSPEIKDIETLRKEILTTVYQKTSSSSEITENAASEVAKALSSEHLVLDVDSQVESYKKLVSDALSWSPSWEKDDLALQNIQARTRAPSVWLIANIKNKLLLVTSNRSECSVGYATMDGDTAGGLSPIAGVDKAFIKEWLIWAETKGPKEIGPVPALKYINSQAPTAELRPGGEQQDEKDLMPYPVLDMIERMMIAERKSVAEIIDALKAKKLGYKDAELEAWTKKFFTLWSRNQWKRERQATSFHFDDYNIEPSSGFRYPVLSGKRFKQ